MAKSGSSPIWLLHEIEKNKNFKHCSKRSQNRIARSPAGNTTLTSGSRQARQSTTLVRMEDRRRQSEARLSSFVVCQIKNFRILVSWMINFRSSSWTISTRLNSGLYFSHPPKIIHLIFYHPNVPYTFVPCE